VLQVVVSFLYVKVENMGTGNKENPKIVYISLEESNNFIFVKIKTSITRKINSLRCLEVQN
jgi:hypothetical protein